MPLETAAKSSAKPAITIPTTTVDGGDSRRPFTLKDIEAPGTFSGIKHPAATTWLIDMSHWIRLSKVLEDDLWDVVASRMSRGALTWINAKMSVADEWGVRPWVSWQAFKKALKAQFEPLSKEERAREQIWKLVQTRNVNTHIYHFRELKNEIPSMNSSEAYNLFMDRLNPQLHQLARTMVTSRNLEEVIEIVKKATVYGEKKVDHLKLKLKTNKNGRVGVKVVEREARAIGP